MIAGTAFSAFGKQGGDVSMIILHLPVGLNRDHWLDCSDKAERRLVKKGQIC